MDHIAVLSDVHGNLHALEAVLADIRGRGIETIYCLGDLAGKGPRGAEVVDLLRDTCTGIVRGNWDDGLADPQDNPDIQWYQRQLGEERRAFLKRLPNTIDFTLSGNRVRLFHASPISEHHRIQRRATEADHLTMFTNTDFTGHDLAEPTLVGYGDIHDAFVITMFNKPKTLFNVGSAGNPLDVPLATYIILHGHLASDRRGYSLEIVRLEYDVEGAIADAAAMGMPQLEPYAIELRTGLYRGRQGA